MLNAVGLSAIAILAERPVNHPTSGRATAAARRQDRPVEARPGGGSSRGSAAGYASAIAIGWGGSIADCTGPAGCAGCLTAIWMETQGGQDTGLSPEHKRMGA